MIENPPDFFTKSSAPNFKPSNSSISSSLEVKNITGKDVADTEYRLDKKDYGWKISGLEVEASLGETQDRVHSFIKSNFGSSRKDIKNNINIDGSYLSKILKILIKKDIIQERDGCYYAVYNQK